ncbi:MAG: MarR family winged helix-turn-helix transcriptional regulator [Clostridia bacterium]|nr:MarR family winged helix-turn-helix transcriptional regulator [Clostridia bacterium]
MSQMPDINDIGFLIKLIHDDIDRRLNDGLRTVDMTASQGAVLAFLRNRGEQPTDIRTVQSYLGIAHPTVCGLVRRLKAKGFLQIGIDPHDRRARILHMTPKGWEMFEQAPDGDDSTVEDLLLRGLKDEEIVELRRLLTLLHENVK